jgi:hypothetical protein
LDPLHSLAGTGRTAADAALNGSASNAILDAAQGTRQARAIAQQR